MTRTSIRRVEAGGLSCWLMRPIWSRRRESNPPTWFCRPADRRSRHADMVPGRRFELRSPRSERGVHTGWTNPE